MRGHGPSGPPVRPIRLDLQRGASKKRLRLLTPALHPRGRRAVAFEADDSNPERHGQRAVRLRPCLADQPRRPIVRNDSEGIDYTPTAYSGGTWDATYEFSPPAPVPPATGGFASGVYQLANPGVPPDHLVGNPHGGHVLSGTTSSTPTTTKSSSSCLARRAKTRPGGDSASGGSSTRLGASNASSPTSLGCPRAL
jgi:hypothetical protein